MVDIEGATVKGAMLALGISALEPEFSSDASRIISGTHDTAAVLLVDGALVAAAEEERFTRVKHTSAFPVHSIAHCLSTAQVDLDQIDLIGVGWSRHALMRISMQRFMQGRPYDDPVQCLSASFLRGFGRDVSRKLRLYDHHACHAWSAVVPSGYQECLVVTIDGAGEGLAGTASVYSANRLVRVRDYQAAHQSLGYFYWHVCRLLGYQEADAYKVMGLAPYGDPARYGSFFSRCYTLLENGNYRTLSRDELFALADEEGIHKAARRRGGQLRQEERDLAAGLQRSVEHIILHMLTDLRRTTGQSRLCLAGGVAHNCSANGKIWYSKLFDEIFVQPAAHDAGIAIGAACLAAKECGDSTFHAVKSPFLGTDVGSDHDILQKLQPWAAVDLIEIEELTNAPHAAATLIAAGHVVAWVQGRAEFGPRALGARSILADPRPVGNKDRINAMVKKREAYRPFAPSVSIERAAEFFEIPEGQEFPYMTFVLRVRDEWREILGAVTHIDGTARVQTVSREMNERYWTLLNEVGRITGIPMVLNTSFNNHSEPIVDNVHDAVTCFLTTDIDVLVIGNILVRKRPVPIEKSHGIGEMAVVVPDSWILRRRRDWISERSVVTVHELVNTPRREDMKQQDLPVSLLMYSVLHAGPPNTPLKRVLLERGVSCNAIGESFFNELILLWQARAVAIHPVTTPAPR